MRIPSEIIVFNISCFLKDTKNLYWLNREIHESIKIYERSDFWKEKYLNVVRLYFRKIDETIKERRINWKRAYVRFYCMRHGQKYIKLIEDPKIVSKYSSEIQLHRLEYPNDQRSDHEILKEMMGTGTLTRGPESVHSSHVMESVPIEELVPRLIKIEYVNCAISSFPSGFLKGFVNLRKIDLRRNKFTEFPMAILEAPCVTYIDISHNEIDSIPEEIKNLGTLDTFKACDCCFTEFPKALNGVENLRCLWLSSNDLKEIPELSLKYLKRMRFDNTNLKGFPMAVLKFEKICSLDISHNEIYEIPEEFSKFFGQLDSLGIDGTGLKRFPKFFKKIRGGISVYARQNGFTFVPKFLKRLRIII